MHPRSPEAHSVFGTGALLLCQPSEMVRVAGIAPASSSFRGRPSAADITPWKNGTRGRSLTFIPGVRSAVLCALSYASVNGMPSRSSKRSAKVNERGSPPSLRFGAAASLSLRFERRLVRLPGVAPGHSPWRGDILLLNHSRKESKRAGSCFTPGPCHFNKEQTPLAILRYQPTVSRWLFRCLGVHLLKNP